jgi:hypothetical protein
MPAPIAIEDDDLDELPPLDGDVRDAPDLEADDAVDDDGDASLDDETGEDAPADSDGVDLEGAEREKGWMDEPADAGDLDLGEVALVELGSELSTPGEADEADERPVGQEDLGFADAPERGGLDGDDEGPLGADDELREADLPPLDADEEGDLEDAALVESAFAAAEDVVALPWAAEPWSRVGAPVALAAATAVACAPRGALVAGRTDGGVAEVVRVDLEGTSQTLPVSGLDVETVRVLAVEGERIAALVDGGGVRLSRDGGVSFAPVAEGRVVADLALVAGALWVRTRAGALLRVDGERPGGGLPLETGVDSRQPVVAAMACDGASGVAAIVVDDAGQVTGLLRAGPEGDPILEPVEAPEPARLPAVLAVRGAYAAYAGRRGGVVRRGADGVWTTYVWEGHVTALAFVDDAGTLAAATYSDVDDTTALVCLEKCLEKQRAGGGDGPAESRMSVVARIGPARSDASFAEGPESVETGAPGAAEGELPSDGRVLALAYDDARGVVWVAGGFGVASFAVR